MRNFLLTIGLLLVYSQAFPQGPPITADTPVMLGLGGNGVRTFGKIIFKENSTIYVQPVGIPYNITSKFQLGAIVPFKRIAIKNGAKENGISDVTFFSKYQLYKKDGKAKTFRILAQYKQTFPTASTNEVPAIGSGMFQTYLGIIAGKISSKIGIYGDVGYLIKEGEQSEIMPYNISFGIPLLPQQYPQKQINAFLEFNGSYVFKPAIHEVFLSPGLQYIPGRRILFETSFQYPMIQKNILVNKTLYRFVVGARFLIN